MQIKLQVALITNTILFLNNLESGAPNRYFNDGGGGGGGIWQRFIFYTQKSQLQIYLSTQKNPSVFSIPQKILHQQ